MKKLIQSKNLRLIIGAILFLVLTSMFPEFKNELENITPEITPIPTITVIPTITPNAIPTKIIEASKSSSLVKVTKIVDGDTIKVNIGGSIETVRMIGVDTPEIKDPRKTVQCFGKEASTRTKELLENQMVKLEADSTQNDRDKYSRLLRYIYLENGTFINKKLIEEGYAFEYTYQIPYLYQAEFKAAQKLAKTNNLGLWNENSCSDSAKQNLDSTKKN